MDDCCLECSLRAHGTARLRHSGRTTTTTLPTRHPGGGTSLSATTLTASRRSVEEAFSEEFWAASESLQREAVGRAVSHHSRRRQKATLRRPASYSGSSTPPPPTPPRDYEIRGTATLPPPPPSFVLTSSRSRVRRPRPTTSPTKPSLSSSRTVLGLDGSRQAPASGFSLVAEALERTYRKVVDESIVEGVADMRAGQVQVFKRKAEAAPGSALAAGLTASVQQPSSASEPSTAGFNSSDDIYFGAEGMAGADPKIASAMLLSRLDTRRPPRRRVVPPKGQATSSASDLDTSTGAGRRPSNSSARQTSTSSPRPASTSSDALSQAAGARANTSVSVGVGTEPPRPPTADRGVGTVENSRTRHVDSQTDTMPSPVPLDASTLQPVSHSVPFGMAVDYSGFDRRTAQSSSTRSSVVDDHLARYYEREAMPQWKRDKQDPLWMMKEPEAVESVRARLRQAYKDAVKSVVLATTVPPPTPPPAVLPPRPPSYQDAVTATRAKQNEDALRLSVGVSTVQVPPASDVVYHGGAPEPRPPRGIAVRDEWDKFPPQAAKGRAAQARRKAQRRKQAADMRRAQSKERSASRAEESKSSRDSSRESKQRVLQRPQAVRDKPLHEPADTTKSKIVYEFNPRAVDTRWEDNVELRPHRHVAAMLAGEEYDYGVQDSRRARTASSPPAPQPAVERATYQESRGASIVLYAQPTTLTFTPEKPRRRQCAGRTPQPCRTLQPCRTPQPCRPLRRGCTPEEHHHSTCVTVHCHCEC